MTQAHAIRVGSGAEKGRAIGVDRRMNRRKKRVARSMVGRGANNRGWNKNSSIMGDRPGALPPLTYGT